MKLCVNFVAQLVAEVGTKKIAKARAGWTVEVAFPWAGMAWLANGRSLPPQDGDQWRLFIGRYQQLHASGQDMTVGWAWHPIGSTDNHMPERFTPIQFSTSYVDDLPAVS